MSEMGVPCARTLLRTIDICMAIHMFRCALYPDIKLNISELLRELDSR